MIFIQLFSLKKLYIKTKTKKGLRGPKAKQLAMKQQILKEWNVSIQQKDS